MLTAFPVNVVVDLDARTLVVTLAAGTTSTPADGVRDVLGPGALARTLRERGAGRVRGLLSLRRISRRDAAAGPADGVEHGTVPGERF